MKKRGKFEFQKQIINFPKQQIQILFMRVGVENPAKFHNIFFDKQ